MASIPKKEWGKVGKLYQSGQPMRAVAEHYGVSIDAVTYVLSKFSVPGRSFSEANRLKFEAKPPSFTVRAQTNKELEIIGAMLYWAEGYKRETACGIDFANSDPDMALLFLQFLCARYILDKKRLYFSIYHYSDQNIEQLIALWCQKLGTIPKQFKNHYMRQDPKTNGRKLSYGVLHIRYNDKKLLRDVLNLIDSYKLQYASVG